MAAKSDIAKVDRTHLTINQTKDALKWIFMHNLGVGMRGGRNDEYLVPMLWGKPGVGKTSIVSKAVEDAQDEVIRSFPRLFGDTKSFHLVTEKIADKSPEEISGYPAPDESTGTFKRLSPKKWTHKVPIVGFLDEIAQANTDQQNVARAILNERMIGDIPLPAGSTIVCASNPMEDRAGTHSMPTHVRDVLMHLYVTMDHKEWCAWGMQSGIHHLITSFIWVHGAQWLHDLKTDPSVMACPSPRSWSRADSMFKSDLQDDLKWPMVAAMIGSGATLAFRGHVELGHLVPDIDKLIADPEHKRNPKSDRDFPKHGNAVMYILCCALATRMDALNAANIVKWMKRVEAPAYCSFLLGMALERNKDLRKSKDVREWLINHESDLLLG